MTDEGSLICWNCSQRTPPGNCIHCDAALSRPDDAFEEEEESKPRERILEIRRRDQENIRINLQQVIEVVESNFTIKKMVYGAGPQFVVEHPGSELSNQFENLLHQSENMVEGFKPMVERYKHTNDLLIKYVYNDPPAPQEYRIIVILGIFTIISVFLSGIFNYTQLQNALNVEGPFRIPLLDIIISGKSLLNALMFTGVLVFLIALKDIVQLKSLFQSFKNKVTPFYIPAPPIFELGTFGSINKQDHIHQTRQEMFKTTFIGPILAWFSSLIIIFFSLPLASYNPGAAESYGSHSIAASGGFEPVVVSLLARLSNSLGFTNLDLSEPLTTLYILHPVTLAAIGGFYIITFSLFPAAHFNGGFFIRSTLGKRAHWILTYLTIIAVYFINWMLSVLLFFIHELLKTPEVLNEETPIYRYQRLLLIPYAIIIFLSYPFQVEILQTIIEFLF